MIKTLSIYSAAFALSFPTSAAKETLSGKFEFETRKPFVALVYLADDQSGDEYLCGSLDQKDKTFSSRLIIAQNGCEVVFTNSDEMNHNIFANDVRTGVSFDVGLIAPGTNAKTTVGWAEGQVLRVGCKIHPKMRSYIANTKSAYATAVTFDPEKPETHFSIPDIPEGEHKIVVWFPKMESLDFALASKEAKKLAIQRNGKTYGSLSIARE